ncbi:MAG: chemotaxis response regulator protein-glutamate methylesterase [Desulfobacteraceae bacterium IS3]|nr:MAG: chemotaxis response regulator protein-glutamate methylesterase [Desulfobacteraceae bacterium IS3]
MKKIKVLICDDSALMRRSLKKIIESDPELEVVGTARDGEDSVNKARQMRPDVVTMDVNMPGMDGITALQIIVNEEIAPVLMVSSLTQEGAIATFESMALGAFDYVPKPGGTVTVQMGPVAPEMIKKIKAAAQPGVLRKLTRKCLSPTEKVSQIRQRHKRIRRAIASVRGPGFKAVAIGISTGGPKTLFDVLPFLPEDLPAAIFLVQHMPGPFISSYARRIDNHCHLRCVEVEPGMIAEPGTIYLAKGGFHLALYRNPSGKILIRTPKKPEHTFIPSVDIMMNSVLEVFGADTVGVLMTGMGKDGAESMVKIRQAGGITIAESEESAIVFGMPGEAIAMGGAEIVAPSWDIAEEIIKAVM